MIYILIILWGYSGKSTVAIEFNDLKSCQAAGNALQKQMYERAQSPSVHAVLCAPKGEKK